MHVTPFNLGKTKLSNAFSFTNLFHAYFETTHFKFYFQEAAKFFIPEEKMEEEIEKALDVTFNYNFAMDLEGNRHIERPDFSTKKSTAENSDDFAPRLYGEVGGDQNRSEAEAS